MVPPPREHQDRPANRGFAETTVGVSRGGHDNSRRARTIMGIGYVIFCSASVDRRREGRTGPGYRLRARDRDHRLAALGEPGRGEYHPRHSWCFHGYASSLAERAEDRHARGGPDLARAVALAGPVLRDQDVAGAEAPHRAVADLDVHRP